MGVYRWWVPGNVGEDGMRGKDDLWTNAGNAPVPGAMSPRVNLNCVDSNNTGLLIRYGASSPNGQAAIQVTDTDGTAIMQYIKGTGIVFTGIKTGAVAVYYSAPPANFDGTQNPPCLSLPDGTQGYNQSPVPSNFTNFWSGTGAPSSSTVGTANVGDIYYRRDTPGVTNQNVYICTVAGSPGTWSGIA